MWCGSGLNADRAKGSELESANKKLGGERNLVGTIASVRGMNDP